MSVFGPTPFPGVPALLQPLNLQGVALAVSNLTGLGLPTARTWGIWNQAGNASRGAVTTKALIPDSIVSLDYKIESRVSNAPMEQGAFQAYNKVQEPSEVTLLLTKGGSDSDRLTFLQTCAELQKGLALLTLEQPEGIMQDMNLSRYNYRRTATEGFTLLQIEAHFVKIRVNVKTSSPPTVAASGAATQATSPICQAPNAAESYLASSGLQEMPQTAKAFGVAYPGT